MSSKCLYIFSLHLYTHAHLFGYFLYFIWMLWVCYIILYTFLNGKKNLRICYYVTQPSPPSPPSLSFRFVIRIHILASTLACHNSLSEGYPLAHLPHIHTHTKLMIYVWAMFAMYLLKYITSWKKIEHKNYIGTHWQYKSYRRNENLSLDKKGDKKHYISLVGRRAENTKQKKKIRWTGFWNQDKLNKIFHLGNL